MIGREAGVARPLQGLGRRPGSLEVGERAAAAADRVGVGADPRVEEDGAAAGAHPPDEVELLEQEQGGVDRRHGDPRQRGRDGVEHLLGGEVLAAGVQARKITRRWEVTRWWRSRSLSISTVSATS